MPMSAKILKIEPEFADKVRAILEGSNNEFIYKEEDIEGSKHKLAIYVSKVEKLHSGFKSNLYIDEVVWFTRGKREYDKITLERLPILTTSPVEVVYYYKIPAKRSIEHVVAVSPASKSDLLIRSITGYLTVKLSKSITPFAEIQIMITKENESQLRKLFSNIVRVSAKDLVHDKISSLGIGGPAITETEEWIKTFYEYEGKASSLALLYKGYWIMISRKGIIFSLSKDIEAVKDSIMYEILEKLYAAELIQIS